MGLETGQGLGHASKGEQAAEGIRLRNTEGPLFPLLSALLDPAQNHKSMFDLSGTFNRPRIKYVTPPSLTAWL